MVHSDMTAKKMPSGDVYRMLNDEAGKVSPGSDGLIAIPHFMGERTPGWDTLARGVLFGLTLDHGRGHIVRALMEGAGYGLLVNLELMLASGVDMKFPVVLSEGGANSMVWRQIVADILNVECVFAESSKGAPVGNAVMAGVGVGIYKDYTVVKNWVELGDRSVPNPENVALYKKFHSMYRDLYAALKEYYVRLADTLV
jgi:xylulokinase